ncbi:TPA: VRR-NUC domain-containing protein, partial [Corynebacterium striatum]|nr:VRR-NUC domain-containing protein [Corynebacterium striatum]
MNERNIEQHLKQAVEAIGGLCWKFTSPGTAGV